MKLPYSKYCTLFFSIGGLILDTTVSDPNLVGIVVYTPVINGKADKIMFYYISTDTP